MRLISQDGKGDMPYENFVFRVYDGDIVASRDILTNEKQIVARYSTEAKAQKVVEMLREQYQVFICTKTLLVGANNSLTRHFSEGQKAMLEAKFRQQVIFKFPVDEDVEV